MNKEEKQQVEVLEKYVQQKSKQFTVNDAAAVTGLPVLETEYAIKDLMEKYDCKLKVTEGGDLIYDFGSRLHRRTAISFAERFNNFMKVIWRGFTIFYKVMISVFLVVYFIIFLFLVLALVVAALSGGKDNNSKGVGQLLYFVFRIFLSIFQWQTIMGYGYMYRRTDRHGYNYRHYTEKPGVLAEARSRKRAKRGKKTDSKDKKGFVASIYDFVFGPPRVPTDPFAEQRELATFLRDNKGLVSVAELQALSGWTRDEANNFMTEVLGAYDGKAKISPNALLYGDFSEFIRSKDRTGEAPVIWYWDEYEPEYEITGNKTGRNAGITAINAFNLILSATVIWGPLGAIFNFGNLATIFLGWVPLVYSTIFFLIPLIRIFLLRRKRKKQHKINIRKRLMKAIYQDHTAELTLEQLTEIANEKATTEEKLNEKVVEDIMMDVIYDLGGESYLNANNKIAYKFDQLDAELDEIEQLRKEKRDDSDLGEIVFKA